MGLAPDMPPGRGDGADPRPFPETMREEGPMDARAVAARPLPLAPPGPGDGEGLVDGGRRVAITENFLFARSRERVRDYRMYFETC